MQAAGRIDERPVKGQILLDGKLLKEYRGVCPVQYGMAASGDCGGSPSQTQDDTGGGRQPVEQRLLDSLHIEAEWLDRYPAELSGGRTGRGSVWRGHCWPGGKVPLM